jgi:hypothetical protein
MEKYDRALKNQMRGIRRKHGPEFVAATGLPFSLFWNPMTGLSLQALKSWLVVDPGVNDVELWKLIHERYGMETVVLLTTIARACANLVREYWAVRQEQANIVLNKYHAVYITNLMTGEIYYGGSDRPEPE